MKLRNIITSIVIALLAFPLTEALAQVTINVLETYDAPGGAGTQTRPQKINDSNNIAGIYLDSAGVSRGFYRFADGTFRDPPIVDPNDDANLTEARANDNRDMIGGDYSTSDGVFHGFFLKGNRYQTFDISSTFTIVLGMNNRGSAGSYVDDSTGIQSGFTNLGGNLTTIVVPQGVATLVYGINNVNSLAGYYTDDAAITHGFYVDRRGRLRAPLDPAGSNGTVIFAINDKDWIVGRYADASGITHGFLLMPPNDYTIFDYPGSTFTSLNGINTRGFISGRYTDSSGIDHGFIAKASGAADNGATEYNIGNAPLLTRPTSQLAPRLVMPEM